MRLLLSNDDGLDAPGLAALESALAGLGDLWVSAPAEERSAVSHAITMRVPVRAEERGVRRFAVHGTPVDSVYLGINQLMPERPDLVLSGINRGANLGTDVLYSGTVAVAAEACLQGISAVAVSLELGGGHEHWETAGAVARRVVESVLAHGLPACTFLNVNVPAVPLAELRGLRVADQGRRLYATRVRPADEPGAYWIGGPHIGFEPEDSDGGWVGRGWATVSALSPLWNAPGGTAPVRAWTDA